MSFSLQNVNMYNSYSFLALLDKPGFKSKFKTGDGTRWEVREHWTFLNGDENSDLLNNLGHIVIIKQKSHGDRAYSKKFEAYPLEQTEYTTIEKEISDSCYWFSISYREYDEAFRPKGKGSFQKILCKLTLTLLPQIPGEEEGCDIVRRGSVRRRYDYTSLQNIPRSEVKDITMKTALECLLQAVETHDADMKNQAIEFIVKNFGELKKTELWKQFCVRHRELKDTILDIIIEHMGSEEEHASMVLLDHVSLDWDVNK